MYLSKDTIAPRPARPSAGHQSCEQCGGMGFSKSGDFGVDRKFVACEWCKGLGQKYLECKQ